MLYNWPLLVQRAWDLSATPTQEISAGDVEPPTACLKHVSLYIRRTDLHDQESMYLNFDAAAIYLSHMLEVPLPFPQLIFTYSVLRANLIWFEG